MKENVEESRKKITELAKDIKKARQRSVEEPQEIPITPGPKTHSVAARKKKKE